MRVQIATTRYNLREFDAAQADFESIVSADPHRLDGLDIYSNILYVKEARTVPKCRGQVSGARASGALQGRVRSFSRLTSRP